MSLWVMADTHLSFSPGVSSNGVCVSKPMDRFGGRWTNHAEKIARRWSAVVEAGDTVVIPGDISWAGKLEEAEADLRFLASLPGRKLLGKGNHDYWWTSLSRMRRFLEERGIGEIDFLYNNAFCVEGRVLAGSRGWFLEEHQQTAFDTDYAKLVNRECERLELSLTAADKLRNEHGIDAPALVFLHFPPVWGDFRVDELLDVMLRHGVRECWYGHIHGQYEEPPHFEYRGIRFTNAAADYLDFLPRKII